MTAPIALFAYKRLTELKKTVQALQANYLASLSELHVFVDGPKNEIDYVKVRKVQQYIKSINGFKSIHYYFSDKNKGCAQSIIEGVTKILQTNESIIVIEDDIVTSPNFLNYMNQCLKKYKHTTQVFSIGGYTFPFKRPESFESDIFFFGRTCAWGWAIWEDRWFKADWNISDYYEFRADYKRQKAFNYYGSDLTNLLKRTIKGEIDTWDILLCYNQFKCSGLTAYPVHSKVINVGFNGGDGMHAKIYDRYKTTLDLSGQQEFVLPTIIEEIYYYTRKMKDQYSIRKRLYYKLKTIIISLI